MANTRDLRYVRTERAIRSAFLELVGQESVGSVTVSGICQRAEISRNAFYLHHAGVPALYAALVDELVEDVMEQSVASANRVADSGAVDYAFPMSVLGALSKHETLLRALLPSDDGTLAKRLAEGIERAFTDGVMLISGAGGSFERMLACSFGAWALVGLVARWVSITDRPLIEALQPYERLQLGVSESFLGLLPSTAPQQSN